METKTTGDLEQALGLTAGNIFHGALGWPFPRSALAGTPAGRWGVAPGHTRILLCGSAARRGGAVSRARRAQRGDGGVGGDGREALIRGPSGCRTSGA